MEITSMREQWPRLVQHGHDRVNDLHFQALQMASAIEQAQIRPEVADVAKKMAAQVAKLHETMDELDRLCRTAHTAGWQHSEDVRGVPGDPGVWGQ